MFETPLTRIQRNLILCAQGDDRACPMAEMSLAITTLMYHLANNLKFRVVLEPEIDIIDPHGPERGDPDGLPAKHIYAVGLASRDASKLKRQVQTATQLRGALAGAVKLLEQDIQTMEKQLERQAA